MTIAPGVVSRSTKSEQNKPLCSRVDELAAHRRSDPHQPILAKDVLDALDQQGQLTLEHEKDLLLLLVRVYTPPLARLEHDQVHPKSVQAQLAAQWLETLVASAIEHSELDIGLSHRASIEPREKTSRGSAPILEDFVVVVVALAVA